MAKSKPASFDAQKAIGQVEKDLLQAVQAGEIINALARGLWIKEHQSEPPQNEVPSVAGLKFEETESAKKFLPFIGVPAKNTIPNYGIIINGKMLKCWRDSESITLAFWHYLHGATFGLNGESIEAAHTLWMAAREDGFKGRHPLSSVVESILPEWKNMGIQIEPFRPQKKAQLTLFGRIEKQEGKRLIAVQTGYAPPQTELNFPELQRNDIVASWLLDLYGKVGGMVSSGRGAPYPLRLFVGGLLYTPIEHRDGEFHYFPISTDEVISWLHPDIGYVKRQRWDAFRNGLKAINELGWVSIPGVGQVKVLDASVIPEKPTDPIVQFIVRVPPSAAHGATLDWGTLCEYGRESARLYRAYLTACEFMHRSALRGQPITQMIGRAILDQHGNPIKEKGKVKRSKRKFEHNPLTRYVKGLNKAQLAQSIGLDAADRHNRRNALGAFERLADDGIIDLQKEGRGRGVQYHIFAPNKWQEAQAEEVE